MYDNIYHEQTNFIRCKEKSATIWLFKYIQRVSMYLLSLHLFNSGFHGILVFLNIIFNENFNESKGYRFFFLYHKSKEKEMYYWEKDTYVIRKSWIYIWINVYMFVYSFQIIMWKLIFSIQNTYASIVEIFSTRNWMNVFCQFINQYSIKTKRYENWVCSSKLVK